MVNPISRRQFLKNSLWGIIGLIFPPSIFVDLSTSTDAIHRWFRVTVEVINVREKPEANSLVIATRQRDDLIRIYEIIRTEKGRNPIWYRVPGGYVHSAYLQPVEVKFNSPETFIPGTGYLAEITVPYSRAFTISKNGKWDPIFKVYYGSVHVVKDVIEDAAHNLFYKIEDFYQRNYVVSANHLRIIRQEELSPISPDVPNDQKWLDVSIGNQTLIAYEKGVPVLTTNISSGIKPLVPPEHDEISTETPLGDFHIVIKSPTRHMGQTSLSAVPGQGSLAGVPWVSFFDEKGYSIHGTYWHANFGVRMSHGCINMRNEDAKWIYRWANPKIFESTKQVDGWGTRISIHE